MNDNPIIADVESTHSITTGLWAWESAEGLINSIESDSWVDPTIGAVSVGLDALSITLNPIAGLLSLGISWLMEQVEPLREALDDLTGDADVVESYAATWDNMADALLGAAQDLDGYVSDDIGSWTGEAANSYVDMAADNSAALGLLAGSAAAMASATRGAGMLVAMVREIVRELIADCVSALIVRAPMWAGATASIVGSPWAISDAAALIAKWVGRIASYTLALTQSLEALTLLLQGA